MLTVRTLRSCAVQLALTLLAAALLAAATVEAQTVSPAPSASKGDDTTADLNAWRSQWDPPPDIDQVVPPATSQPCPLSQILEGAAQRMQEFLGNLQQFSASEIIEAAELKKNGRAVSKTRAKVNYVAALRVYNAQPVALDEYRNDTLAFPLDSKLETRGTLLSGLIFHPLFARYYEISCEGLSDVNGTPAWQVHFVQRPNAESDFREYHVRGKWYPVRLKGRAWIACDTYQVLRIVHDLATPIPAIRLRRDYVAVQYQAVNFPAHNVRLWLPISNTIYVEYNGHRYLHTHRFSNFKLFWVDVQQHVKLPAKAQVGSGLPPGEQLPPQ